MVKPWILVSPASQGIGLQIARRLLKTTDLPIVATARRDIEGTRNHVLSGLGDEKQRLDVLKLDLNG